MGLLVELVVDRYCLSLETCHSMVFSLAQDFDSIEIIMRTVTPDSLLLNDLEIRILPSWLLNDRVLKIDPFDYEAVKEKVLECLNASAAS